MRIDSSRRGARKDDRLVSCWVAFGYNARTACALVTDSPGLLEASRNRFDAPDTSDEQDGILSAF
ncbi:hypothetical protein OCOJLMKI_5237 [Methylobacterium iners]|uniref:Transposase n=1 Tax=Methylobacterium iners TaxID=418707 RepID=A0ABQ4S880_9HYPH|nr:hypothetical protein OCOJLMKI_5237 [Methylobacterium iners]